MALEGKMAGDKIIESVLYFQEYLEFLLYILGYFLKIYSYFFHEKNILNTTGFQMSYLELISAF